MHSTYRDFLIRDWQPSDRQAAADLIAQVLTEYGLASGQLAAESGGSDWDVLHVEAAYWQTGGEFWVVEQQQTLLKPRQEPRREPRQIVGTAGYYPIQRGEKAVEIRKMYLLPQVRGQGLGRHLLQALEQAIQSQGYRQIWLETASVLQEAVKLYESSGYQPTCGVETPRCDRVYVKTV